MYIRFILWILPLLCWLPSGSPVSAEDAGTKTAPVAEAPFASRLSIDQILRSMDELEQSSEVAIDVKLQATDNYKAAVKNLQSAAASDARLQALIVETESIARRAEQFKQQRAELKDKKPTLDSTLSLQELEQLLPATEIQLSTFKKARADAETELQARAPRRKEIRERIAAIDEKIADAVSQLGSLSTVEPTPQTHSLAARLGSRRITLEKEKPALEAELTKYDAEDASDLVRIRMDLAACNASFTEKLIALLQRRINAGREATAEEAVQKARREAIEAAPALRVYAQQNQELAEHAKSMAEAIADTERDLTKATEVHEGLVRQFAQTRKKVDSVGLTSSVGALLRKQMTTLPSVEARQRAVANRQNLINETQFQLLEYEEQHQELAEFDRTIALILKAASKETKQRVTLLESAARDLMIRKREYLEDLIRSTGKYFDTLIELDMVDRQVIALEAEYGKFIDERVLWIRSGRPLTSGVQLQASDAWMLQPRNWSRAGQLLLRDAKSHPFLYSFCLGIITLLLARGRALRCAITEVGLAANKANCRSIGPTIHALVLTSLLSLGMPLLCVFLGWRLSHCGGDSDFASAIGNGFAMLGILWAAFEWMRQACRENGLGEAHFGWVSGSTIALRRELKICTYIALPIVFTTATLASREDAYERNDMQRIAFLVGMSVASLIAYRLMRPRGLMRGYLLAHRDGLIGKCRYLFPLAAMSIPASLGVLAASGYFYTAQTLYWRLFATCVFVGSLIVVRAVLFRMLLLRRRYLSMEQARQRAAAAKGAGEEAAEVHPVAGIVTENPQADISAHTMQSRRLVGTAVSAIAVVGLWMIWIQVLPALHMVGNYAVLGKKTIVAATEPATLVNPAMAGATGGMTLDTETAASKPQTTSNPVTLSDLALAVLILVVTVVLFRNGPGLLEMSVLQQLPFDASVRYAITTLVSYAIVMVGIIMACSTVGLQWSQIQWLATALTFGLAFGLQEMFANFVSGLIILLERPIRVGDIVTVDDVTGVVSRIRIRATSITNWDRKEYVVPNKEFITGRLLNWTLSDKVNRVMVTVGLAYGSDTERARELLLQVANDHPVVLKDPASMATFEGFGDNSLNLVLRAFLPSLENRLQVIHELHTSIDQAFRKAGLEIAFPQRDLHIRSMTKDAALTLQSESVEEEESGGRREAA
jgi:potassium efflux system protein